MIPVNAPGEASCLKEVRRPHFPPNLSLLVARPCL